MVTLDYNRFQSIQDAIEGRPDPSSTVIREHGGCVYALGSMGEGPWILQYRGDRYCWFTDYISHEWHGYADRDDFRRFLLNKVEA